MQLLYHEELANTAHLSVYNDYKHFGYGLQSCRWREVEKI